MDNYATFKIKVKTRDRLKYLAKDHEVTMLRLIEKLVNREYKRVKKANRG